MGSYFPLDLEVGVWKILKANEEYKIICLGLE